MIVLTIFAALVLVAIEACADVPTVDFTGCGAPHGSEEVHALLAPADSGLYAISHLLSVPLIRSCSSECKSQEFRRGC